jgi:type IV pilus assembly protein PilE
MIGPAMNTNSLAIRSRTAGFTLVELMIAIAIIGLLTALAVPGYREHVRRGAVEEAMAELSRGQVAVEQYFLDNRSYANLNADGRCPAGTTRFPITCSNLSGTTYTMTANGTGNVSGFVYSINQQGVRASSGSWGSSAGCWIIKKGGSCGG